MASRLKRAVRQTNQEVAGGEVGEFRTLLSVHLSSEVFLIWGFINCLSGNKIIFHTTGLFRCFWQNGDWLELSDCLFTHIFFGKQAQTHGCVHTHPHFFIISTCCSRWDFLNPLVSHTHLGNESIENHPGREKQRLEDDWISFFSVVDLQASAFKCSWWRVFGTLTRSY